MGVVIGLACLIVSQFRRIRDRWTGEEKPDGVLFAAGVLLLLSALAVAGKQRSPRIPRRRRRVGRIGQGQARGLTVKILEIGVLVDLAIDNL